MIVSMKIAVVALFTLFMYFLTSTGKVTEDKDGSIRVTRKQQSKYKPSITHRVYDHVKIADVLKYSDEFGAGHSRFNAFGSVTERDNAYYSPGDTAEKFSLDTVSGTLVYPGTVINASTSVVIHAYDDQSAFQKCLWFCEGRITPIITHSPTNTHYVFLSYSANAEDDVTTLRGKFESEAQRLISGGSISQAQWDQLKPRLHYVITPVTKLGNWLAAVLSQWLCKNHNCGIDQVRFLSPDLDKPTVLRRLNARAYWLPFPGRTFKDQILNVTYSGTGCVENPAVFGHVALLSDGECSAADKIYQMELSGAIAVLVIGNQGSVLVDMYCNGEECKRGMSTPSAMVEHDARLPTARNLTVQFQNTPNHNYYMAIDGTGKLAEMGWFITPTYDYMVWMAQWFNYRLNLTSRLDLTNKLSIPVMDEVTMQGNPGAQASIKMPPTQEFNKYTKMELDMALTCPGTRDVTCAEWDRTVRLWVCCHVGSPLCQMELGRWISPYRRRIGRWLTDVTPLKPLLDGDVCNFTMATDSWSMPWKVSVNLILSDYMNGTKRKALSNQAASVRPFEMKILYQPGFRFDKDYNTNFAPINFTIPSGTTQTKVVAVITGHGSDNNQCAEFCVTSHHFVVNGHTASRVFDVAGTTLGCANKVNEGATPNEHGTWVYGRAGWCPGQNVAPWEIDVTNWVTSSSVNTVHYYGLFNGTDPNPTANPGVITIVSYLVFYKEAP